MELRTGSCTFTGLSPETAMPAALGASLMGVRALLLTDDAGFCPAPSRVNGGVAVAKPLPDENFDSLDAALLASEQQDRIVQLELQAALSARPAPGAVRKYRKTPERFVPACEREQLCPGCPYRAISYLAAKLWLRTIADTGCALCAQLKPFQALDAAFGPHTALAALAGAVAAAPEARRDTIALLGQDSLDAGQLELLSRTGGAAVIVGPEPSALPADFAASAAILSAFDLDALGSALRAALDRQGLSLIFCQGRCREHFNACFSIDQNRCRRCGACSKLGCPAISGRTPVIEPKLCVGCSLCAQVCKCSALRPVQTATK